jgi:hypothetical protein
MREAMYGWMTLHLKGETDGSPIREPAIRTEDPEALRCYPADSRPKDWVSIPRFAAIEGRRLLMARTPPASADAWRESSERLRTRLVEKVFGGFPKVPIVPTRVEAVEEGRTRLIHFQPEPGIDLVARVESRIRTMAPLAILIDLEGAEKIASSKLAAAVRAAGWGLVTLDLRATGKLAPPADIIGQVPDHNSAEWGLWIGRPLLGQWAFDVRRLLDALERTDGALPPEVVLVGRGPGGLIVLCAGALDKRVTKVAAVGTLASYLTEVPFAGQRLGVLAPGIVREVGDVTHLVALNAPRRVIIAGGVAGDGQTHSAEEIRVVYREASRVWDILDARGGLSLLGPTSYSDLMDLLR